MNAFRDEQAPSPAGQMPKGGGRAADLGFLAGVDETQ
jgi:hypothetical protein